MMVGVLEEVVWRYDGRWCSRRRIEVYEEV